ncbi:MAG: four helix bundle protein [Bacteroides sp.]|jgi:four helix bundle protein|nr:four helix bundle protein [Bacteroides sp.]
MKEGVSKTKSLNFAIRVVSLYRSLRENNEFVISKEVLRSGTAIGALIREAEYAESGLDFIHKMSIAQKECNETLYWIELLKETDLIDQSAFEGLYADAVELMKLLTAIIKKRKENLKKAPF